MHRLTGCTGKTLRSATAQAFECLPHDINVALSSGGERRKEADDRLVAKVKVLVTVPRLEAVGGVANYYAVLRRYIGKDVDYFEIGMMPGGESRLGYIRRFLSDFWHFHRQLSSRNYDIIHVNPSLLIKSFIRDGILILIAKWHGMKVIVFFRGWDADFESLIRRYLLWLFRNVYGRADAFIVLATEFREKLSEFGVNAPVFLETTIVDDRIMSEFDRNQLPVRSVPAGLNILFLSRLVRDKGLPESIAAFGLLKSRYQNVCLTIAGDGPEREGAEKLVSALAIQGVNFVGNVEGDAKRAAYAGADLFLYPTSFGEGMPNVVLEAMAYGLPVVTSPAGGLKDFFENERMGFLTESKDPGVIAGLLARLVQEPDLREAMGAYNRQYAREHFAASRVAARLIAIYEQVGSSSGID